MTIQLGKFNQLTVVKQKEFGMYLDGGDEGEILLPARYVPQGCQVGDTLNVFIYLDMEERLVATTETPLAQAGQFACLEVAWTNRYGAFLHWGPMKDLFVPFAEQRAPMEKGQRHVVYVHVDEQSYRIVGSAKIDRYLSKEQPPYAPGDTVQALVWDKTPLGYKAVVDGRYAGLIYANETFRPVKPGDTLAAYVKQVREDGKIDLALQKSGGVRVLDFADTLLQYLREHGGRIGLTDKSSPEEIHQAFGVSKKTFKQGVGSLYKQRLVQLLDDAVVLAEPARPQRRPEHRSR